MNGFGSLLNCDNKHAVDDHQRTTLLNDFFRSDATAADDKYLQLNHWIFIMQRNREIVYYSYHTALKTTRDDRS